MSGSSTDPETGTRMEGWRIPGLVLMQGLLPRTWRKARREGMIENRPVLTFVSHVVLAIGIAIVALPVYITFVASTLAVDEVLQLSLIHI